MTVLADGHCRLLGASADARGVVAGEKVRFEARFAADRALARPSVDLELRAHTGRLVLADAIQGVGRIEPGQAMSATGEVDLGEVPGDYYVSFVLRDGGRACLRAVNALALVRLPGAGGALCANGTLRAEAMPEVAPETPAPPAPLAPIGDWPALLHLTHWKAGSQWLHKIIMGLAAALEAEHDVAEARVAPPFAPQQMIGAEIAAGRLYPTLYLTRRQYDTLRLPTGRARPFVVIRDLRDALVSAYFSQAYSHPTHWSEDIRINRARLAAMDREQGLMYLLERFLPACADIQWSWLGAGVPLLRYKDLLEADVDRLVPLFTDYAGLPLSAKTVAGVVESCRFEALTGGRARGDEDTSAHERRGEAGDWRRHFTPKLTAACKALYGDLLIAGGYESDTNWKS
ncbi:MAG: sulfotransferase domain-containing protein [Alphaproteobacteria bacterium]